MTCTRTSPQSADATVVLYHDDTVIGTFDDELSLRALIGICPDPVLIHDGVTVLFVNEPMMELLGAAEESELVGRDCFDHLTNELKLVVTNRVKAHVDRGEKSFARPFRFGFRLNGFFRHFSPKLTQKKPLPKERLNSFGLCLIRRSSTSRTRPGGSCVPDSKLLPS